MQAIRARGLIRFERPIIDFNILLGNRVTRKPLSSSLICIGQLGTSSATSLSSEIQLPAELVNPDILFFFLLFRDDVWWKVVFQSPSTNQLILAFIAQKSQCLELHSILFSDLSPKPQEKGLALLQGHSGHLLTLILVFASFGRYSQKHSCSIVELCQWKSGLLFLREYLASTPWKPLLGSLDELTSSVENEKA